MKWKNPKEKSKTKYMSNNLKRNAYVMIDHWSQILTVLISLYIYKKKEEKDEEAKQEW